ncbi:MFS transporter [Rhodococcus sp. NPDC019627]|uniref:MFS transporter n=1 Tax=unclassified Rhodococcus (in: high G+C Gram-positive bacteria) TaxID=192944 RepID=UPI0037A22709
MQRRPSLLARPSRRRARAARAGSGRLVVLALASCGIAVSLMQTIVMPLLPEFPRLLHTTPGGAVWLVTVNLIAGAVCAPVLGRLGDMYGKRRLLLIALAVMATGSALGALFNTFAAVLIARALQGAAVGAVPLGISIMRDELPPRRVAGGIALMSSTLGAGGAIGLPLTGVVAEHLSWHWLFGGAAVIGVLGMGAIWTVVPESPVRSGGKFDLLGALGLTAALVCLLLAIIQGNGWGWGSRPVLGLFAGAAALFLVWGSYELRLTSARRAAGVRQPLVDLRVSARRPILLTNIASILVGFAMFTSFMVSAQIFQAPLETGYGYGMSLTLSGLALLPAGLMMVAFSPVTAYLSHSCGPRRTFLIGTTILMATNLVRAVTPPHLVVVIVAATVTSVGAAFAYGAIPAMIMRAVPTTETAAANSLNTLARSLGTSTCSAVVAALTTASVMHIAGVEYPTAAAYAAVFGIAAAAGLLAVGIGMFIPRDGDLLVEGPPAAEMWESAEKETTAEAHTDLR